MYALILYYSSSSATFKLAKHIAAGVSKTGVEAMIRTVPRVAPTTEKADLQIPEEGHVYVSLEELANCSGLALGSPTRFGMMAAPLKHFLDTTSKIWMNGSLIGKPACVFTSTSSMHGGQEATLLSMMVPLLHHGMLTFGIPYSERQLSTTTTGGTPYGASHVAGPKNELEISDDEKQLAIALGERLGHLIKKVT